MDTGDDKSLEPTTDDASAKATLLDHAEAMFATHGYDGVSLRELTREARTNLASVNYHFGSKEKLFEEVVLRRVRPMNARRVAALQQVMEEAGNGAPALAKVLEAFARPCLVGTGSAQRQSLKRMAVRMFMDADPLMKPIFEREIIPVARQFLAALVKACSELSKQQVESGLVFFAGAMINLMAAEKKLAALLSPGETRPSDEEMLRRLVRFGVAGFAGLGSESPELAAEAASPVLDSET
jgi:AcrR family transcriptional regulator